MMATLSHGSDLRLAPTIRPIADVNGSAARRGLSAVAALGFSAVQLDATMPGLRPRELDNSARRDLRATAGRCGLDIAGLDLFIPTDHYHDPAYLQRAADAAVAACSLAADLGRVPLSLNLPIDEADPTLLDALLTSADALGVPLVICHTAEPDALKAWLAGHRDAPLSLGIDPAALLIARHDPSATVQACAGAIGVARLADAKRGQADARVPVGKGDLDLVAYRVSVDLTKPRFGPVVLDLRSLSDPASAATAASAAWQRASISL